MVDRAHVNEAAQWGVEATPGTPVPADKQIRSMSLTLGVEGENDVFRPDGHKWGALVAPTMEWTSFRLEGRPTYTEIMYPLESIAGAPVVTTVGTAGKKRVYTIQDTQPDDAQTLTIEKGSAVRASQITYGLVTELGFTFNRRNGVAITGGGIGQLLTDGVTMTASPTALPLVPIIGKQIDVYIDGAAADLGTTKMLRAFAIEPALGNKYGPVWPIDSDHPSWDGHVELVPTGTVRLRLEADAAGMAYLAQYRSGDLIFVRVEAIGSEFEAGQPYQFTYDTCLGVRRITDFGADEDGVTVLAYETDLVADGTWGKAIEIAVTNDVAAV
jgi:hypothetical protein